MTCKFGEKDGITFFQCTTNPLGGPSYEGLNEEDNKKPYAEGECPHFKRAVIGDNLTCLKCGAVYNEDFFEWLAKNNID